MSKPLAYLITYTCYGQWLHGDVRGPIDLDHNVPGEPWLAGNERFLAASRSAQTQSSYRLDAPRRQIVLAAIREVCRHRGWRLWAAHVRTQHVHLVVTGDDEPEKTMSDFKAYGSRALNVHGFDERDRKRWSRHGSTKFINDDGHLENAIVYVLYKQGDPQEVYDGRNENEPRA